MPFDLLSHSAAAIPDKPAIVQGSLTVTYSDLVRAAGELDRRLRDRGLGPGDTVALQVRNSAGLAAGLMALWRMGATVLPLDPELKAEEVESCCTRAGAATVVRQDDGGMPPIGSLLESTSAPPPPPVVSGLEPRPSGDSKPALILVSSGSTGLPKLVCRGAASIRAAAGLLKTALPCSPDDRVLGVLPLHHSAGLFNCLLSTLQRGATLFIEPFRPRENLETIRRHRITVLIASPFIYRMLAETRLSSPPDLSSLRLAYSGTSAMSRGILRAFEDRFDVSLTLGYGTTETNTIAATRPGQPIVEPNMVGRPYPAVTVTIRDDDGVPLPPGSVGVIWVKSPAAATEYFRDPKATAATFIDGHVVTGDLGRMDESGNLYIIGRKRPLLNIAGKKAAPAEIEACLRAHPAVADAAVVPEDGGDGYVRVTARVVRRGDVSSDELRNFCAARLADFKVPRRIVFVSDIGRGPLGKNRGVTPASGPSVSPDEPA